MGVCIFRAVILKDEVLKRVRVDPVTSQGGLAIQLQGPGDFAVKV